MDVSNINSECPPHDQNIDNPSTSSNNTKPIILNGSNELASVLDNDGIMKNIPNINNLNTSDTSLNNITHSDDTCEDKTTNYGSNSNSTINSSNNMQEISVISDATDSEARTSTDESVQYHDNNCTLTQDKGNCEVTISDLSDPNMPGFSSTSNNTDNDYVLEKSSNESNFDSAITKCDNLIDQNLQEVLNITELAQPITVINNNKDTHGDNIKKLSSNCLRSLAENYNDDDNDDDDDDLKVLSSSSSDDNEIIVPSSDEEETKFVPRTKGELTLSDLPLIENLSIEIPEDVQLIKLGCVMSIIDVLVVIHSDVGAPALDIDSLLFLDGRVPFGQIFETFGPVKSPWYSVRFNSKEEIEKNSGIQLNAIVHYAPQMNNWTKFVFLEELKRMRGSDASWKDNNEPPASFLDYSDDEKERNVKKSRKRSKPKSWNKNDSYNHKNDYLNESWPPANTVTVANKSHVPPNCELSHNNNMRQTFNRPEKYTKSSQYRSEHRQPTRSWLNSSNNNGNQNANVSNRNPFSSCNITGTVSNRPANFPRFTYAQNQANRVNMNNESANINNTWSSVFSGASNYGAYNNFSNGSNGTTTNTSFCSQYTEPSSFNPQFSNFQAMTRPMHSSYPNSLENTNIGRNPNQNPQFQNATNAKTQYNNNLQNNLQNNSNVNNQNPRNDFSFSPQSNFIISRQMMPPPQYTVPYSNFGPVAQFGRLPTFSPLPQSGVQLDLSRPPPPLPIPRFNS